MKRYHFMKVMAALLTSAIIITEFDYSVMAAELSDSISEEAYVSSESSKGLSDDNIEALENNNDQDSGDTSQPVSGYSDEIINSTPEELHQRIINLPAYYSDEKEGISISSHSENIDVGESVSLTLIDENGDIINDVSWFCRIVYPKDTLGTAADTRLNSDSIFPCTLSDDGTVTGVTENGDAEIWASYGDYLYRCLIRVNTYADKRNKQADDVAQEIAQSVSHLSDVDKLMAVHDYLIENITYDLRYTHGGINSALLDHRAVCKGYAQAFSRIVNKLNIPCETVLGYSGDVCHEWNKVQLNGKWYYVDVTQDDKDNDKLICYKGFLMGADTFVESQSSYNRFDREDNLGNDYKYYAYKKLGYYAENQEELKTVLRKQFDSTDASSVTVYAAIPQSMDNWTMEAAIKEVTSDTVRLLQNDSERLALGGGYTLNSYIVSDIPDANEKDSVSFVSLEQKDRRQGEAAGFIAVFDKDVDALSAYDISVNGLNVTEVISKGNGVYEINVNNILLKNNEEATLSIGKRNVKFSPDRKTINFRVDREETPQASFDAIDGWNGLLKGCEAGMKYAIGNGEWNQVQSTEPIPVTLDFRYQVRVIRQSSDASLQDSEIQYINMSKPREPYLCKAQSSTGSKSDGKILYVTKKMEYRKVGEENYIPCTGTEVTGLEAGDYEVRYAAKGTNLASDTVLVSIEKGVQLPPYTISYELDGGVNNTRNPEEYMGDRNVTLLSPTKEGYSFSGWFIDGEKITALTPVRITTDITLTAAWKENTYLLNLQGNGGRGKLISKSLSYSEIYNLNQTLFSKDGYVLSGWNTDARGKGKSYPANGEVSKLCASNNGKLVLYAQWKLETFSINYELDGAVNSLKNPDQYSILKAVILDEPVKQGYVFLGFYDAKDGGNRIAAIGKNDRKDYTLYARFAPIEYRVFFNANAKTAKGTMSNISFSGAEEKSLPKVGYSREGYNFKCWNTKSNGNGTSYSDEEVVSKLSVTNGAKLTLYAIWEAEHKGNIIYHGMRNADNSSNPDYYTALSDIKLKSPVCRGYSFLGFYRTDNPDDKTKVTVIKKTESGDVNLYARWQENSYKVVYNANYGTLKSGLTKPADKYYFYSEEVTVADEIYFRKGYKFVGYNTSANGTGISYSALSTNNKLTAVKNGRVILYAQWEKAEYSLSYSAKNAANSSVLPRKTKHFYSDSIVLPGDILTRKGYRFTGWALKTGNTSQIYAPSEEVTFSVKDGSNIVLYATWEQDPAYTITYELDGGTNNALNPSKYGAAYDVVLKNPVKTGYTFAGWYREPGFNTKVLRIKKTSTGDVTLYAKWLMNSYTIGYVGNGGRATGAVPKAQSIGYTDEYTLAPCAYKRTGYRFVGWCLNSKGNGRIMLPGSKISKASSYNRRKVNIYAIWKKDGEK